LVGAIDEAGRGPLAGPVVAACVILTSDFSLEDSFYGTALKKIRDSKKLSAKKREELAAMIKEEFMVGVGVCDHSAIDRLNILKASFLAMKKALGALKKKPDFIILDGKFIIPNLSIPQKAIIDGDAKVFSIAAASIIAKVTRDQLMKELHQKHPQYGFDRHKGYGTKLHLARLKERGPCEIHRRSFEPVRNLISKL